MLNTTTTIDYLILCVCVINFLLQLYITIKNNNSSCSGQFTAKRNTPNGGSYQKKANLSIFDVKEVS